jgi:hypothetical protein
LIIVLKASWKVLWDIEGERIGVLTSADDVVVPAIHETAVFEEHVVTASEDSGLNSLGVVMVMVVVMSRMELIVAMS